MRRAFHALLVGAVAVGVSGVFHPVASAADTSPLEVRSVTASADDGNVAANTLDNDLSTRWSAEGDGAWIRYDLGSARTVGSVSVAWHRGDSRKSTFDVQLSADGSSWTTVLSRKATSGTTLGQQSHDFADASARYVRIVGHGNTVNDWTSITETDVYGADGGGGDGGGSCAYPADVLDLTDWYIGLPVGEEESPTNVYQPELATYANDPWFVTADDCSAVRFRAPVNGVTTSGSSNPRSELREMTNSGRTKASWSSTSGTHTMVIDQAITDVPEERPYVVAGQIHDASDDVTVFRLEGSKLYITDGDTSRHRMVTDSYELGTRFQAKFEVSDGETRVYYNGALQTTLSKDYSGAYFKAGAYTQANCGNSDPCSGDNYGQVKIYDLDVTHGDGAGEGSLPRPPSGTAGAHRCRCPTSSTTPARSTPANGRYRRARSAARRDAGKGTTGTAAGAPRTAPSPTACSPCVARRTATRDGSDSSVTPRTAGGKSVPARGTPVRPAGFTMCCT
ncbi:hypothetical protein Sfulv_50300 [Streptomyces fulvorobeus]|uniref:F5/8 type C domain-containing protein n=1 Tax=Streptomyces fulvorobeus TaxID=284028 RepID=A0A7J0CCK4_9ACTN|nr:polysaccharide lyase family 7 protein [Streptomyces fulvorobeus]GFN00220.1 hypothetical protein Sfulv_50300 [Streptomyces fulvorobeus]